MHTKVCHAGGWDRKPPCKDGMTNQLIPPKRQCLMCPKGQAREAFNRREIPEGEEEEQRWAQTRRTEERWLINSSNGPGDRMFQGEVVDHSFEKVGNEE